MTYCVSFTRRSSRSRRRARGVRVNPTYIERVNPYIVVFHSQEEAHDHNAEHEATLAVLREREESLLRTSERMQVCVCVCVCVER